MPDFSLQDFLEQKKSLKETPIPPNSDVITKMQEADKAMEQAFGLINGQVERTDSEIKQIKEKMFPEYQALMDSIKKEVASQKEVYDKKLANLETETKKILASSVDIKEKEVNFFRNAVRQFLRQGDRNLNEEQRKKFLHFNRSEEGGWGASVGDNAAGGFLVSTDQMLATIVEPTLMSNLTEYVMRDKINQVSAPIPIIRDPDDMSEWLEEHEEGGSISLVTEQIRFNLQARQVTIPVTFDWLIATLNPETIVFERMLRTDARRVNRSILYGKGLKGPQGIFSKLYEGNANNYGRGYQTYETGTAEELHIIDVKKLWESKKIGAYRSGCKWFMGTSALSETRFETTTTGAFIWTNDIRSGIPLQLNGQDVVEIYEMPEVKAGKVVIMYGDLSKAYGWVSNDKTHIIRDELTRKNQREIEFTQFNFADGKILDENALVCLKVKEK